MNPRPTSALACAGLVLSIATPAEAETAVADDEPKKLRAWNAKLAAESAEDAARRESWHKVLNKRIGKKPKPVVNIHNLWTLETMVVSADDKDPIAIPEPTIDRFFRCHFTNAPIDMDPRLFGKLVEAARHFDSPQIDIVSAFRSPKFNLILRKKGREVARRSQHTLGHAVDFRLHGVSIKELHGWVRKQRLGGVGFYPHSKFIHMDTAQVRYWTGR